jgi:hypothetical protein
MVRPVRVIFRLAFTALCFSSLACTTTASPTGSTAASEQLGDASGDGPNERAVAPSFDGSAGPPARCCRLLDADADAGDNCAVLSRSGTGVTEPCLDDNLVSSYGVWTCGADAGLQCTNNGLSCAVGDPCTLLDEGCQGVVQDCFFPWYTPHPG